MDEECYHLAVRAISAFKFPRIPTEYKTFYAVRDEENRLVECTEDEHEEAIPHGYFVNELTSAEIEVLIA